MSLYAIGDLHFSTSVQKPMNIFGDKWYKHEEKIINSWKNNVKDEDVVLVLGDTSWGINLNEAKPDLDIISNLPGNKIFIKGNHDYWWGTKTKLEALGFKSIRYIYNDHVEFGNYIISGTRGWYSRDSEIFTEDDEKIFNRELNRLKLSLDSFKEDMKGKKRIVMIHYPPFNCARNPNEFLDLMIEYNVDTCVYGHLHGEGHNFAIEGNFSGVKLLCVSSDYLGFKLKSI